MSYRRQIRANLSLHDVLDTDLPPKNRTEANLWKARYFEAFRELQRANKGIRRLRAKLDRDRNNQPQG